MSIENDLKRIADALEIIAAKAPVANPNPPKAEAPAAAAPPAEDPPKRRGRPPAAAAPAAPPPPPAEPALPEVSGSFLDDDPAPKVYTKEEVRASLVNLQKRRSDPEFARKLLKDVGGVDTLAALDASKFAAVVAAADKA